MALVIGHLAIAGHQFFPYPLFRLGAGVGQQAADRANFQSEFSG